MFCSSWVSVAIFTSPERISNNKLAVDTRSRENLIRTNAFDFNAAVL